MHMRSPMTDVTFVFPNLSSLRQRGGLSSHIDLARDLVCEYLEVPCDYVKNGTGVERTGLELGSPLPPSRRSRTRRPGRHPMPRRHQRGSSGCRCKSWGSSQRPACTCPGTVAVVAESSAAP